MKLVIFGSPVTKKNSQRIIRVGNGRRIIKPSAKFEEYQEMAGLEHLGDITKLNGYELPAVDVVIGGSPC